MSQNADKIRQGIDAFNAYMRGELSSEIIAEGVDPQVEMVWREPILMLAAAGPAYSMFLPTKSPYSPAM